MFASSLIERLRVLFGSASKLGSLQLQLYMHEMRNARRNIVLVLALAFIAGTLLLAGVVLSVVAAVWLLVEAGYSTGTAISVTAGTTFLLFIIVCGSAVMIVKNQMRRMAVPSEELKANFACIRDQVLRNS